MIVIKRDGREVQFDKSKIVNAILNAMTSVNHIDNTVAEKIANEISNIDKKLSVEEIQDIVEKKLMASSFKDVAKQYILYREERSKVRLKHTKLMKDIREKLSASNVQNQNANIDEHSFGGRKGEAMSSLVKQIALDYVMSPMARDNHVNNRIYIHDLDSYLEKGAVHNCLSIPFDDLLANGFKVRQTDVRPAGSINTAFQLVAVIFQLQSLQQFGGVSATHLDWTMVPYVRKSFFKHWVEGHKYILNNINADNLVFFKDKSIDDEYYKKDECVYNYALDMTIKELNQAVEGMYHNLNTLQSRSGNQLPFTSINYGTCTLTEGRLVTKALIEGSIKGVGKVHKTPIFPCGIFQCMNNINRKPGDTNYDLFKLALKSTAQRLYPNYANVDWSGNKGYDINDPRTYFSTMGCRTANGWDINGLGQLKDGRGNICPVTIIMPTLAMETVNEIDNLKSDSNHTASDEVYVEKFIEILDKAIFDAKDMLIERFELIASQTPDIANFMYENKLMAGYIPEEGIRSALKHGTLALG